MLVASRRLLPADVRFGPYCGALLHNLSELVLRSASLELSSPALFEDMLRLRRLDMQGCTSSRTGSWLSRVLGSNSDVVALPEGLVSLQAIGCNVFDKCVLELGAATGLQLLEVSSSVQLPATLKHAAHGAVLGLHIAEEGQVRLAAGWRSEHLHVQHQQPGGCLVALATRSATDLPPCAGGSGCAGRRLCCHQVLTPLCPCTNCRRWSLATAATM